MSRLNNGKVADKLLHSGKNCINKKMTNNCRGDSLILAHVVFRHGHRTPLGKSELYPTDPHNNNTYFPIGFGQLTNQGKQKMYDLGKELRKRYNGLLGDVYYPDVVDARSTKSARTIASLQYCLAGLFPPNEYQLWNKDLNWQAIPVYYKEREDDKELLGVDSSEYFHKYSENLQSDFWQQEFKTYQETFDYINEHSGLNMSNFWDTYLLYFGLKTETECGLELPKWWDKVWPEKITEMAIRQYSIAYTKSEMKKLCCGLFFNKIIEDTMKKIKEPRGNEFEKKMYLYSVHDSNMAMLLFALGAFDNCIPKYGSYISFEVHKINDTFGFKIYYQNYEKPEPVSVILPNCQEFCPLDDFVAFLKDILPDKTEN